MNKEKKIMTITIAIISFIFTCVIFMQFKVVNETDITQIESMREDELEKAASDWKEKYEEAAKQLEDTNKKTQEYQEKLQTNQETDELVRKELAEANKNFGLTDVTGDGIIITLTDTDEKGYDANDIVELINELRAAGADAISINEERVTNITDIANISTRFIAVNSNKISSPYVIKAIGDKTYLKSALTIKNGYFDLKQKDEYKIEIQEKSGIKINKYSKELKLKYIDI